MHINIRLENYNFYFIIEYHVKDRKTIRLFTIFDKKKKFFIGRHGNTVNSLAFSLN